VSGEQLDLVQRYFYARIWAAPATLALYAFMGWFFGMQNAIYPLILTIAINVVNIIFSYTFVYHYGMDVDGVAYGTVISQYFGLALAVCLFWYKYKDYAQYYTNQSLLKIKELRQFLSINSDIFIRTFCLTFAFGFFYSQSAAGGAMILAVNVILLQFLNWMSYGVDGFAYASESLVGKYAGAKDEQNLKQAIRLSFVWGMGLALVYSLVYWIFGTQLVSIFTNENEVVIATMPYLFWMIAFPVIATPCYIWDGIFIGLMASKAMKNSMILALIIYMLAYYGLAPLYQIHGLWAALLLFMAARGVIQAFLYPKIVRK